MADVAQETPDDDRLDKSVPEIRQSLAVSKQLVQMLYHILGEHLSSFMLVGYDYSGNKVQMSYATSPMHQDALRTSLSEMAEQQTWPLEKSRDKFLSDEE